ncbi:hypothetical protein NUZ5A_20657 [Candidatus Nitrosotenuis uzonensis]|uniref:Uncharacterized protein n=1 Tax=Candidatus Nitrosotenuis uzonensis TaxID=1407055 RepID=A0A812F5F1_9ARCH|nr:hypothetical protein NUZ5A_20657 [Candidatus Nitrosotenuis uzonensis]
MLKIHLAVYYGQNLLKRFSFYFSDSRISRSNSKWPFFFIDLSRP